jgi:hypothetical protein
MMDESRRQGLTTPGDNKIPIPVRDWSALKLALWRSKTAWEITVREAAEIVSRCRHVKGCPGEHKEAEPCVPDRTVDDAVVLGCADRETRMSALVILNAARMFAPIDARRPAVEQYWAPSREHFSEVMTELSVIQIENDVLRAALRDAGLPIPTAPTNLDPPQLKETAT